MHQWLRAYIYSIYLIYAYISFHLCACVIISRSCCMLAAVMWEAWRQKEICDYTLREGEKEKNMRRADLCFPDYYTSLNVSWSEGKYGMTVWEMHGQHLFSDLTEKGRVGEMYLQNQGKRERVCMQRRFAVVRIKTVSDTYKLVNLAVIDVDVWQKSYRFVRRVASSICMTFLDTHI